MIKNIGNKTVALIPARSSSKRIKDKNIKEINGHPLLAYTIVSAKESKLFDEIVCVTDSEVYAEIAIQYGASVPMLRPKNISGEKSPDVQWVDWIFKIFDHENKQFDIFCILRPTSPLRGKKQLEEVLKNS